MALTASEFIALKNKIKAEMARRNGYGSLADYAGSEYDFTTTPAAGQPILTEQGQKVVDLALAVTDIPGLVKVKKGDKIPDKLDDLEDIVDGWAAEPIDGSSSSCRGVCTGLCTTGCASNCSGTCGDSCTGCGTSCSGKCGGDCTGSCSTECTGCAGNCSVSCGGSCSETCGSSCPGQCRGCSGCQGGCSA